MKDKNSYIPCRHSLMLHDVVKIKAGDWTKASSGQYESKDIDIYLSSGDRLEISCFRDVDSDE